MDQMKRWGPWLMWLVLQGCVTVEAVSVSQIPAEKDRHHRIAASARRPVIFSIPFGTSYVEEARGQLMDKCRGGAIEGVVSKFQSTEYFLGFVGTREVIMSGYCLAAAKKG